MIAVGIAVYIVGLLVFYVWGIVNTGWHEYYYLWDKGKDLLVFIAMYEIANKRLKKAIKPVIIFSIIRFLWQVISSVTSSDINNVKAVDYLFVTLVLVCSYLTIKDLYEWHKSNGH